MSLFFGTTIVNHLQNREVFQFDYFFCVCHAITPHYLFLLERKYVNSGPNKFVENIRTLKMANYNEYDLLDYTHFSLTDFNKIWQIDIPNELSDTDKQTIVGDFFVEKR